MAKERKQSEQLGKLSEAARREVIEKLGGQRLSVPTRRQLEREERRERVRRLLNPANTYAEVADEVGASVSTVYRDSKRAAPRETDATSQSAKV